MIMYQITVEGIGGGGYQREESYELGMGLYKIEQ